MKPLKLFHLLDFAYDEKISEKVIYVPKASMGRKPLPGGFAKFGPKRGKISTPVLPVALK